MVVVHNLKNNSGASKGWVELHVDSMVVVHNVKNNSGASNLGWRLLHQICHLMELDLEVKIRHTYRKVNSCPYDLTNLGCDSGVLLYISMSSSYSC
jgi:hypothetical protein